MRPGAPITLLAAFLATAAAAEGRRPLALDDLHELRDVRDPRRSPDGQWVAYTVAGDDKEKDKVNTDLWMVSWDGARSVRLTSSPESETTPRFSPDGRYLAFLSSRQSPNETAQLWLLDRAGGEAERVTSLDGSISDYDWAPDGKRLVLVVRDPDPEAPKDGKKSDDKKTAKPIVIDRYHFKQDVAGYLGLRRTHLFLFDLATKKAEALTSGAFDDRQPAWSPDGRLVAFVSKREGQDPDRGQNSDVFVIEARAGAEPRKLTTSPGDDNGPLDWSPDGTRLAYLQGTDERYHAYNQYRLAVVALVRRTAAGADRDARSARGGADVVGRREVAVLPDRGRPLRPPGSRPIGRGRDRARPRRPPRGLRPVPRRRRRVRRPRRHRRRAPRGLRARSRGAPPPHPPQRRVARRRRARHDRGVHLQGQGRHRGARPDRQAAGLPGREEVPDAAAHPRRTERAGRALLQLRAPVLRGATATWCWPSITAAAAGAARSTRRAISADWGNKEVVDLLAAVDHAVAQGIADPDRLGVGGWSYGGILTDYMIANDAALQGRHQRRRQLRYQLALYGVDQYIMQYDD